MRKEIAIRLGARHGGTEIVIDRDAGDVQSPTDTETVSSVAGELVVGQAHLRSESAARRQVRKRQCEISRSGVVIQGEAAFLLSNRTAGGRQLHDRGRRFVLSTCRIAENSDADDQRNKRDSGHWTTFPK